MPDETMALQRTKKAGSVPFTGLKGTSDGTGLFSERATRKGH